MDSLARRRRYYMIFARIHGWIVVRTGGRPEHMSPRLRCLVLETSGRRSGESRKVPLLYMPDDDSFVVIASNFGQEHPPAWWLNLHATPVATVHLRGRRIAVRARELEGDDRAVTLARAVAHNKQWRSYSRSLQRPLPVVRLERVTTR